jgi:spore germination cell wall hydrolase CwlJ-like protein
MVWNVEGIKMHEDSIESRLDNIEEVIVATRYRVNYTKADVDCLAKNIYYEAGNQSDTGKYAVATVTLNRLRVGRWGNTVCKVVYSPAQFSWTLSKRLRSPNPEVFERSRLIAIHSLQGARVKGLDRSLLYHADYIQAPKWADPDHKIGKLGQHIFYTKGKGSSIDI